MREVPLYPEIQWISWPEAGSGVQSRTLRQPLGCSRLSSDDVFKDTSARCSAVDPEQWLQRHAEAGSSWPSRAKALQAASAKTCAEVGVPKWGRGFRAWALRFIEIWAFGITVWAWLRARCLLVRLQGLWVQAVT